MKSLTILSGKAMIVEMPEGAETIHLAFNDGFWHLIYFTYHGEILTRKRMPSGRWQIVGMLPEVTEEQAAGMVEGGKIPFDETACAYRDYSYKSEWGAMWLSTALESLESAIRAEGLYLDSPPFKQTKFTNPDIWESVMSRVLPRERCLLLRRFDT